ncbi:MAG: class I SAM-dependent methyltransferase [Polyangiaceae bacterium]|nr:class I SAM-dependent methyltransferase [Polyangiaceae bacterium]
MIASTLDHLLAAGGAARAGARRGLRARLDRAGYHAQQLGLTAALGSLGRVFHLLLDPRIARRTMPPLDRLRRRYLDLIAEDLANVERGVYPRELLFQVPYGDYARALPRALLEGPRMIVRRRRGRTSDLPRGIDLSAYPRYYRRNFHWQSDGWLSERSARIYDLSVEVLFAGTADVMRRMAIPPVAEVARPGLRVLDVGCGTGRFLLQLRAALPEAELHGLDLSPHYIARARGVLAGAGRVGLSAGNAEALPFESGTFDVITSIFLLHELPGGARRSVVREALRVLRPGGRFVLCDAAQRSDGADLQPFLDVFPELYHEPYFKGYLQDDLADLLTEQGFARAAATPRLVSKVVVGEKAITRPS